MEDLSAMSTQELEEYLSAMRADLEEIEVEKNFVLKQTGVHLSASEVKRFDSEIASLRARIEAAEQMLQTRTPQ